MTAAAATLAQSGQKSVWVQDKDGRWAPGRIRALTADDRAVVELTDRATITVPLADVHDAPPPDAGLDDGSNRLQLVAREAPGGLSAADAADAASPEVQHYYELLIALPEALRKKEAHRLLRGAHSDKGPGDDAAFIAIMTAWNMVRDPQPQRPSEPAETLLLTLEPNRPPTVFDTPRLPSLHQPQLHAPVIAPPKVDIARELPGQPFSAADLKVLTVLPQIKAPADLAKLAGTGRSAATLAAIARMRTVSTVDDIVSLTRLARPIGELGQLAGLAVVRDIADLTALATSPFAITRLTALGALAQVSDRTALIRLAALPRPDGDVVKLAGIAQATTADHLHRLAALADEHPVDDIVAIGLLRTVGSVEDIAVLAGLGRPVSDLASLAQLPIVGNAADLTTLAGCPHAAARLTALGVLTQIHDPAELLQIAALPQTEADIAQLAGLAQAASLAGLRQLAGAVAGPRTAADVVTIAGIGTATFVAPDVAQVVQLCGLDKTAADIVQLSTAPGTTNTAQLIALANSTENKEKVDADWSVIDNRWFTVQDAWRGRWPLTTLFAALHAHWTSLTPVMQRLPRGKRAVAAPADLQAYAMGAAQMRYALDRIDELAPAVDEGALALADADARLAALAQLLTEIDNQLIPYYPAPSASRTTVDNQRQALVTAQATLNAERAQLLIDRGTYAALGALTAAQVAHAVADQHNHALAIGAVATAATIDAPLAAVRTAGYQARRGFPNLNLSVTEIGHPFWQSLLPAQRTKWNAKLAGHPVTAWAEQNHPGPQSRARQNGYAGARIMIPVLAGFPCQVSGEVVHDWIFETKPNHGHTAAKMATMLTAALAHKTITVGPNFVVNPTATPQQNGRTLFSWDNTQVSIIVNTTTNPPTLITYFNPY